MYFLMHSTLGSGNHQEQLFRFCFYARLSKSVTGQNKKLYADTYDITWQMFKYMFTISK